MMRYYLKKRLLLLASLVMVSALLCFVYWPCKVKPSDDIYDVQFERTRLAGMLKDSASLTKDQACVHPVLNLHDPVISKSVRAIEPFICSNEPDWVEIKDQKIIINPEIITKYKGVMCDIKFIARDTDFNVKFVDETRLDQYNFVEIKHDFFKAFCKSGGNFAVTFSNFYAGISNKPGLLDRQLITNEGLGLDVLMIVLDSMSQLSYRRTLPKTIEYLSKQLDGVILDGYNIVGDGTPPNLIPVLTGHTELELPNVLQESNNSQYVNVYPFIWNQFKDRGYVTALAEDFSDAGTWTYRMNGFKEQPTDYFMRPFYIAAEQEYHHHKQYCLGNKRRSQVFLDWLKNVYMTHSQQKKFVFGMHSELTHQDNNYAQTMDDDITSALKYLNEGGYLSNTMLILMSDHGARFSANRDTLQGKQEERRPFVGISLPPAIYKKHQYIVTNLKINTKRLTSPFDLYPTLMNILTFDLSPANLQKPKRGISLFSEISKSRECGDIDIDNHWCACINWKSITSDSPVVQQTAVAFVNHINNLTTMFIDRCSRLQLKNIQWAMTLIPSENMLKFKKSVDIHGRVPDLSDNTNITTELFQLSIVTTPGDGHFETTVAYLRGRGTFILNSRGISRTNKYGSDPKCIENETKELRKYCYCRSNS